MFDRSSSRFAVSRVVATCLACVGASCVVDSVVNNVDDAFASPRAFAQTIINDSSDSSNRFESFSTRAPEKIAWLDSTSNERNVRGVASSPSGTVPSFPAPTAPPKRVDDLNYRIPFRFPQGADATGASAIELLYSDDLGATWRPYASVRNGDGREAFLFQAPRSGEYWFVLKTYFKNGKRAFSSTRAYRFGESASEPTSEPPTTNVRSQRAVALVSAPNDELLLDSGDVNEQSDELALEPDGSDVALDDSSSAPELLPMSDETLGNETLNDGTLEPTFVDETSAYAEEDASLQESDAESLGSEVAENAANDFSLNEDPADPTLDATSADSNAGTSAASESSSAETERPGKLKTLSFAKEDGTTRLMVVVRWFRPEEIKEEDRGAATTLTIERASDPKGPWTVVGKELSIDEKGYGWIATADEMKPFYVRTVVKDESGQDLVDMTSAPMDVATPGVREALEPVKTPAPFPKKKNPDASKTGSKSDEISLIRTTSSRSSDDDATSPDAEESTSDAESTAEEDAKTRELSQEADKTREETRSLSKKAAESRVRPRRQRPVVPAPTNPNELELNPLFTRGFGVLFRAAQTRHESDAPDVQGKRSIFTPPSAVARVTSIPPAERRRTPQQIAAAKAKEALERQTEQLKEFKEHEMDSYAEKPELMQGRVFYMDSNGNMTTTPPPEFLQATGDWSVSEPTPVPNGAAPSADSAQEPIYMPQNTEDYDASARSGAATLPNAAYPNASGSASSPINDRYSNGASDASGYGATQHAPVQTPPVQTIAPTTTPSAFNLPNASLQTFPQTSYSQTYAPNAAPTIASPNVAPNVTSNAAPQYSAPVARPVQTSRAPVAVPNGFPPRPRVSR